ncbi:MAG: hypothetical protein ABIQ97_03745 [Lysobacteraceae bacterium]
MEKPDLHSPFGPASLFALLLQRSGYFCRQIVWNDLNRVSVSRSEVSPMDGTKVNKRDTRAQRAEALDLALLLIKHPDGSRRGLSAAHFDPLLTTNG